MACMIHFLRSGQFRVILVFARNWTETTLDDFQQTALLHTRLRSLFSHPLRRIQLIATRWMTFSYPIPFEASESTVIVTGACNTLPRAYIRTLLLFVLCLISCKPAPPNTDSSPGRSSAIVFLITLPPWVLLVLLHFVCSLFFSKLAQTRSCLYMWNIDRRLWL